MPSSICYEQAADRRVAFDPPVNLSADFGDQKAVPAHANETRHLQNREHPPSKTHRQNVRFAAPILFELDFLCDCCQPEGLPMCNQHAEDETRFGRAGEELHKCIFEPAQVLNEPRRSFNETGISRFRSIRISDPATKSSAK